MAKASLLIAALTLIAGCGGAASDQFLSETRKSNGLVIILPGIEGESPFNHDIRRGLLSAGVTDALPIYHWGRPIPLAGVLLNQVDVLGNRIEASKISSMIVQYQDAYPGRPVYLIGHSGGGGIAVFAAEGLPPGRQVDGLVLLSASISSGYDLTRALARTKNGIVNFFNQDDVPLLGIGTTVLGNVDGARGPASGLLGFDTPSPNDRQERVEAYRKLRQVPIQGMAGDGDAHTAATRAGFVSNMVAPYVRSGAWSSMGGADTPVGKVAASDAPPPAIQAELQTAPIVQNSLPAKRPSD